VRDLQKGADAAGQPDHPESAVAPLARREHAYHASEPRGIHVSNAVDIQDHRLCDFPPGGILEIEQRANRKRASQSDNSGALGTIKDFRCKSFRCRGHG
jgi:hypothetical protein